MQNSQTQTNPRVGKALWYVIAAAAVIGVIVGVRMHSSTGATKPSRVGGAFPVGAAKATVGDIPVYLDGLGSVAAFYTVNLHSRVDGQLISVYVKEGQQVKEGDLLAQLDPRPFQATLDSAQGQLDKDQSLLTNAKLDLERYKTLVEQKAAPQQQYDTQKATVGQYEGTVEADKAAVASANLQLTYTRIISPINGRIGLSQVDLGNIVHSSDSTPMFIITQLHPISVVFTIPEDNLPAIMQKFHAGVKLQVEAYNRDKTQKLAVGTLAAVDNEIDPNSGTAKLKAVFDNANEALFPNQFVNVRLLLETRRNAILVPSTAIQSGSQGTYVYVIGEDRKAELRQIKVGIVGGDATSIDSGISAGETVVIDGADKIQPGSAVTMPGLDGGAGGAGGGEGGGHGGHGGHRGQPGGTLAPGAASASASQDAGAAQSGQPAAQGAHKWGGAGKGNWQGKGAGKGSWQGKKQGGGQTASADGGTGSAQ
jgi:multidrug efflux system membrane fusion protein